MKIFETSGTPAGQATAFGLLGHGGYLSVVGYTPQAVELRLSNLMAFDADRAGQLGLPARALPGRRRSRALPGRIALAPFIERRPLAADQRRLRRAARTARARGRIVLIPEADA